MGKARADGNAADNAGVCISQRGADAKRIDTEGTGRIGISHDGGGAVGNGAEAIHRGGRNDRQDRGKAERSEEKTREHE